MIKEILDSPYETRNLSGKFPVSSIGQCLRKTYLTIKGLYKEDFGESLMRTFKTGNIVHQETLRELIVKSGSKNIHLVAGEIDIQSHPFVSGRVDAIISDGKQNYIMDIKSCGAWTLKKLQKGEVPQTIKTKSIFICIS